MTNQSFDNQVNQKLSEHESPVPAGVWEAIEQKKKKRRSPFFWWFSSAGILLVAVGIIVVLQMQKSDGNKVAALDESNKQTAKSFSGKTTATSDQVGATTGENNTDDKSTAVGSGSQAETNSPVSIEAQPTAVDSRNSSSTQSEQEISFENAGKGKRLSTAKSTLQQPAKSKPVLQENTIEDTESLDPGISTRNFTNNKKTNSPELITESHEAPSFLQRFARINYNEMAIPLHGNSWSGIAANSILQSLALRTDSLGIVYSKEPLPVKPLLNKKANWSVDIAVTPFMPLRQQQELISVDRTTTTGMHKSEYKADNIKTQLQPSMAYSISVRKKVSKRVHIGAGLQYGVIKEELTLSGKEINTEYQVVQRLENGSSGPFLRTDTVAVVTSGIRTIDAINSYRFFDIPLSLQYMLMEKPGLSLRLTAGVNLGLYSRYNNSIAGELQAVSSSGTLSKQQSTVRTEFFTGLRLSRPLFRGAEIFAEPYLRFNAGKYANTVINNKSVHQVGMGIGLSFQLGR